MLKRPLPHKYKYYSEGYTKNGKLTHLIYHCKHCDKYKWIEVKNKPRIIKLYLKLGTK